MPYYCWKGVKLDASWCKGMLFARDQETLQRRLLKQEIALISYKQKRDIFLLPINAEQKLMFFQHFYALSTAGVHIWQALHIISEQVGDSRLANIISDIAVKVEQGKALQNVFAQHASVFSKQMVHVVDVGVQSDNLPAALEMLCYYLSATQEFRKKLRSALLLPMVTLAMFLVMLLIILFLIVPQYARLFLSMSQELPDITRLLIKMSSFVASYYMVGTVFIFGTILMVLYRLAKSSPYKKYVDKWILNIPHIGLFIQQVAVVRFLRSLGMLLKGGMALVPALKVAQEAVTNEHFREQVQNTVQKVAEGQELSEAMQQQGSFFGQEVILLITVGQETGSLNTMIERACHMYEQRVERILQKITVIVQPVLMILLGIMVAGLIFAVYVPLFNLADVL